MTYRLLADAVLLLHFGFIVFVITGGFLVLRWRRLVWLHVPCALWGVLIEFTGWFCPLTPLENHLRALGGEATYAGDFIGHYVTAIIYPDGLTRITQLILGLTALAINVTAYTLWWHQRQRRPPIGR